MPGLFGIVNANVRKLSLRIEHMGKALHAGHESVMDRWIDEETGIGLGRESLGIFNPDPQPVFNREGTLALILDGKLYNTTPLKEMLAGKGYQTEKSNDAELALFLYEEESSQCFAQLHGIFAIAVWDFRRRQLTLASDRFGLRPLYYTCRPDLFAFAGEIKGLLALDCVKRAIDELSVADFLAYEYVFGDKTLLSEIRLLPPASVATIRDDKFTQKIYWRLEFQRDGPPRSDDEWVEEKVFLLTQAVERRLQGSVSVGLPLSGGLDSGSLLAVSCHQLGISLPTYTYGRPNCRDIRRAKRLADVAKVPHRIVTLEANYLSCFAERAVERSDGLLNCLSSHGLALLDMADTCQVMMLGNGGDSFFQAVRTYLPDLINIKGDPINFFFKVINHLFREDQLAWILEETFFSRIKGKAFVSLKSSLDEQGPNTLDNTLDAQHIREHQRRYTLQGLSTINHRMEYVEPYYDYDLVDFALMVPIHLRWERRIQKLTLARISPSLANEMSKHLENKHTFKIYWNRGRRRLHRVLVQLDLAQDKNLTRPSSGFTDLHTLLRTTNRSWVEEVLLNPRTLDRGYFRKSAIQQLVDDHMNGKRNLGRQLGALITFELWHRRFLD